MVALNPPTVDYVPLAEATRRQKTVPLDCDSILTARDMGINFGDAMPTTARLDDDRHGRKARQHADATPAFVGKIPNKRA